MRVTIKFHRNDDVNQQEIEHGVLYKHERATAMWPFPNMLTYTTPTNNASGICRQWELQGFRIDEFERFMIEPDQ